MASLSLFTTAAVFVLDSDGHRVLAKYYSPLHPNGLDGKPSLIGGQQGYVNPFKTHKEQRAFEQGVYEKTRKATGDILLYSNHLVLYKSSLDLTFYVVGAENENELMLSTVLGAFYDAVSILLRHQVEKRAILENLDLVVLCLDETVDDGIILETDSNAIAARVSRPRADVGAVDLSNITINEQTIMHAFSVTRWRQAGLVHLLCTSRIASRACHEALQWEQLIRADDHAAGVDMEGLLITDASCQPVLSTHFTSRLIASTCLDVLTAEVISARDGGQDVPPIIKLPSLPSLARSTSYAGTVDSDTSDDETSDDADGGYEAMDSVKAGSSAYTPASVTHALVCCHIARGGLRYVVPVSASVDPILVFAFLEALLNVLADYYASPTVTEHLVKDNFDTVLLLLEEMLSSSRHPLVSETATLKEIVTPPSLVAKLLSAAMGGLEGASAGRGATGVGQMPMTGNQALSSPLPWRKQGIRHKSNEIFFDIVEEVGAIIDKNGQIVMSEVWGSVECKCKLSGMPDLNMTLSNAKALEDCSFHPCVRLSRWSTSRTLSFIPPEGRFTLMEYRLGPPGKSHPITSIPLTLKPAVTIGEAGGSFTLHLASRLPSAKPLEAVVVTFRLGPHATSVSAVASGGRTLSTNERTSTIDEAPPSGRWEFDARTGVLVWSLVRLSSGDRPVELTGTWQSSSPMARPASSVQVGFSAPLVNVSGIRVDSLKVVGDTPPPYKGVRPMMRSGSLEFRW